MALFKIAKGEFANLPKTYNEGYVYLTTDTNKFYIDTTDNEDGRIALNSEMADRLSVTTVGSAKTHTEVLENPDNISKTVLEKGLDKGTAFEILSIDIADIDVGRNIGAKLQAQRAEADMQIANARAEERRAMAIAAEHEMRAKTQEKRAQLLDAEAEVPKAISEAMIKGNIGVMDYYKMQNIVADTSMRRAIGKSNSEVRAIENKKSKKDDSVDE